MPMCTSFRPLPQGESLTTTVGLNGAFAEFAAGHA